MIRCLFFQEITYSTFNMLFQCASYTICSKWEICLKYIAFSLG